MTVEEIREKIEAAIGGIEAVQAIAPAKTLKVLATAVASLNPSAMLPLVWMLDPEMSHGDFTEIQTKVVGALKSLEDLQTQGTLDRIVEILAGLEDRRVLLWIAGKIIGKNETEVPDGWVWWPGPCPDCGANPGERHGQNCPGPK